MTQYTYLPRLSTGFAPAFDTVGAAARGGTSRMTRDAAMPLFGAAFLSTVRAGRAAVRREGLGLGAIADVLSRVVRLALQHRCDLFQQALGQARLGDERVAAGIHRALGVAGERVAREGDDGDGPGAIVGLEPPRRLPAVEAGQREVHDDQIGRVPERLLERLVAVLRLHHTEARELEELAVHLPVVGEVVHDEDQRRLRRRRRRLALLRRLRPARGHARLTSRGTTSVNVEPPPTSLSSVIPPSSMSARRRQMASPRPAPVYSRVGELSAWRKSSKIRSRSSAEMPMPVSATAIAIWAPSGMYPARTSTDPRGVNLMALVRKLMTICLTFCRSVLSCGTSAASWLGTASCERAMIRPPPPPPPPPRPPRPRGPPGARPPAPPPAPAGAAPHAAGAPR